MMRKQMARIRVENKVPEDQKEKNDQKMLKPSSLSTWLSSLQNFVGSLQVRKVVNYSLHKIEALQQTRIRVFKMLKAYTVSHLLSNRPRTEGAEKEITESVRIRAGIILRVQYIPEIYGRRWRMHKNSYRLLIGRASIRGLGIFTKAELRKMLE